MKVYLVRHGRTQGNLEHRYIGSTDNSLAPKGIEELEKISYPEVDAVVSSPMKRCIETAAILFPKNKPYIVEGLRECSFGIIENKTHDEIKDLPEYREWIRTEGRCNLPGAEDRELFIERCVNGFKQGIEHYKDCESVAFVMHGGSIMALMQGCLGGDYFSYMVDNGRGYLCEYSDEKLKIVSEV